MREKYMMNVIEYDKNVDGLNGTSLQGHVLTTYDTLCEVLGQPTYTDANPYEKVACEWTIKAKVRDEFMDEDDWDTKVASIYCWKEGRIPTEEYLWHVGGKDMYAQDVVQQILDSKLTPAFEY